jgi:hypothetical protein
VRSRPALTTRVPVAKKPGKSQEVDIESVYGFALAFGQNLTRHISGRHV